MMEVPSVRDVQTPEREQPPWQAKVRTVHLPSPPESSVGEQDSPEPPQKRRRMSSNQRTTLPPIQHIMSSQEAEQQQQQRPLLSPALHPSAERLTSISPSATHGIPPSGSVPFLPFPYGTTSPYHSRSHMRPFYGAYPYYDPRFHFSFPSFPRPYNHGKHGYYHAPYFPRSQDHSRSSSSNSDRSSSRNSEQARRQQRPEGLMLGPQGYYQPAPGYAPGMAPGMAPGSHLNASPADYNAYTTHILPPPSPGNIQPPRSGLYPAPGAYPTSPPVGSPYQYPAGEMAYADYYQQHAAPPFQPWQAPPYPTEAYQRSGYPPYQQPKRRRGNLPRETTDRLKAWLESHQGHPYPTEDEKNQLAAECNLTVQQISNWFINARRRKPAAQTSGAGKGRASGGPTGEEGDDDDEDEDESLGGGVSRASTR